MSRQVLVIVVLSALLCASSLLPTVHPITAVWMSLGGATLSSPAATEDGGSCHVVVRGADNGIHHKYWKSATGWSGWISLGGATNDQPAVALAGAYLHVVVRGTDNGIYHKKFALPDGPWDASWTNVGGATLSTPALATDGSTLYLFVRGTDNGIYYKYWASGSGWIGYWSSVPGATSDIPALCILYATPAGDIHLVVRGIDNGIYHNMALAAWPLTWDGWYKLPGATVSPPTIEAVTYTDALFVTYYYVYLVVRGTNNAIYCKYWFYDTGTWLPPSGWTNLGGATTDRPALYYDGFSVLYLYVRGTDNGIYKRTLDLSIPSPWTSWYKLTGATASGPTISEWGLLVVRGMDNGIYITAV